MLGWIPVSLSAWMRPSGFASSIAKVDARVGGAFEIVMQSATETFRHTGVYRVIDRPCRLVFTRISSATKQMESLVSVEFRAKSRSTEVVITHERLPDSDAVQSHTDGWSEILELFSLHLAARGN